MKKLTFLLFLLPLASFAQFRYAPADGAPGKTVVSSVAPSGSCSDPSQQWLQWTNLHTWGCNYSTATGLGTWVDLSAGGSQATGSNAIAFGLNTTASGNNSTAFGVSAQAGPNNSTAFGQSANASGNQTTAVGNAASATGTNGVAVGISANVSVSGGIAIGQGSIASTGSNPVAVGNAAVASNANAVAIGGGATASASGAVQLGAGTNVTANTLRFQNSTLMDSGGNTYANHLYGNLPAPTITSGFGTSPSILGHDTGSRVVVGTGGTATSGVITFNVSWGGQAPACAANDETTTTILVTAVATPTTLTLTSSTPWGAGDKLTYVCIGL